MSVSEKKRKKAWMEKVGLTEEEYEWREEMNEKMKNAKGDEYKKLLEEYKNSSAHKKIQDKLHSDKKMEKGGKVSRKRYATGGMMAKGGQIKVKGKSIKLKYVKRCCPSIKNDGTIGNYQYDFVDEMGNPFIGYGNSKEEALRSIEEYQNSFASGGMTGKGDENKMSFEEFVETLQELS